MTPPIRYTLLSLGALMVGGVALILAVLCCFFPVDIDALRLEVRAQKRERRRRARRERQRKDAKYSVKITIPGFPDVKIAPRMEDLPPVSSKVSTIMRVRLCGERVAADSSASALPLL